MNLEALFSMLERNIKVVNDRSLVKLSPLFKSGMRLNIRPKTFLSATALTVADRISSSYISFLFLLCAALFSNAAFSDAAFSNTVLSDQNNRSYQTVIQSQSQPEQPLASIAKEIVFIDSAVSDQAILLDAMQRNAEVVILPADVDGFTYIAKTLQKLSALEGTNFDAIHVVSHGDTGQLRLGSAKINVNTLQSYSNEISVIRNTLDGDILLYGCDVAKGSRGQEFISTFAEFTNSAVLASNNLTGDAAQGGDWVLETRQGDVQTDIIFAGQQLERYTSVLADPVITSTAITSATENSAYSYTISASDLDGDILTFSAPTKPTWLNFDVINRVLSGTPLNADVGLHSVTLRVFDGTVNVDQAFTITVSDVNNAPTGSVVISGSATEGQTLTATNTLADVDNLGSFSYQWKRSGAIVGSNSSTYLLTQPDVGSTLTVTISYTDGGGALESLTSAATATVLDSNVAPTGSVSISGSAKEGQTLTATNTIADANGLGAFSYQWKRSGVIVGGNSSTYFLTQPDVGNTISVTMSYTDGGGTLESLTSAATAAVLDSNVAPTGSVSISGSAIEGQTLNAINNGIADANGLGVLSYQWKRSGVIVGGNSSAYLLTQPDVGNTITVTINYTDGAGTLESLTSAVTATVLDSNIAPTGSVSISGTAKEGQTLTAINNSIADANGLGVLSYQWKRSGVNVGSNSRTYLLTQPDVGKTISVTISYTDGAGTLESLTSATTTAIINTSYPPTGSVVISGSATEGQALTAINTIADADGLGTFSYNWLRSGVVINGATLNTYALVQADVGKFISVRISYIDGGNTAETVVSAATVAVVNVNNSPAGELTISGTVAQNQMLTAITSTITDTDGLGAFSYQWLRGGQVIAGATTNTYALAQLDVAALISVRITYTDAGNTVETVVSAQTAPVANVNDAPAGALTISGSVVQNQVLTANASTIADADGLGVFSYQWLRGGAIIGGATTSTYTLVQQDVGGSISARVSYTDGGGKVEQVSSGALGPVANVNDIGIVTIAGGATDGSLITIADITDIDGTDNSNFSYQWLRDGVSIGGETGDSYTVVFDDVGKFISVVVSYTDDLGTAEAITSNTIGAIRPDVPNVTAPPEVGPVNATGWFTFVVLDPDSAATAFDTLDNSFITPVPDSNGQFRPGETIVTWSATDEAGNVGTATQIVKVVPMAEVSRVQRVAEGGNYTFKVVLNGDALQYPVTVPYTVSNSDLGTGSANSSDHNLVASSATIAEPTSPGELPEAVINFSVVDDGVGEGVETLIITLVDAPVNAVGQYAVGPFSEHTIEIVEANVAPTVSLELSQLQVDVNSASVMAFAIADDVNGNEGAALSYDWSGTDGAISNANGDMFSINPGDLTPGFYTLQVTVDDNTKTENATATDTLVLHVIEALPELDSESDADGDGTDDKTEGYSDNDGDGIAEYLDALKASNVIQILPAATDEFIMQTEPGLRLKLAEISLKANRGSTLVEAQDVIDFSNSGVLEADTIENVGGIFDFTVSGLPVPGQVVNVVIPQISQLPRVSAYRKLTESGWQDFVEDSNNSVSSAAGKKGYCPPPGDPAYQAGLEQGHWCLQLTIEDGGPNDSDGEINQQITDPGGLGRVLSNVSVSSGGGGGSLNPVTVFLSAFIVLAARRKRFVKK